MKDKVIALSGGFDPIHKGHVRMIRAAAELCQAPAREKTPPSPPQTQPRRRPKTTLAMVHFSWWSKQSSQNYET